MARRTPTGTGLVLSLLESDLLWEELCEGASPPYPLEIPSHGATLEERDELDDEMFAGLHAAGLTEDDEVAEEPASPMRVLAKPSYSVDLTVVGAERLRAVAAAGRDHAVLAAEDEQEVALEPLRPVSSRPCCT